VSSRLYVGNLSLETTEDSIRAALEEGGGTCREIHLVTDRETGRHLGFGFAEMATEAETRVSIRCTNGKSLDGRAMTVVAFEALPILRSRSSEAPEAAEAEVGCSSAARDYAAAHAIHYAERDVRGALLAYCRLITVHPGSPEAGYARSQVHNITTLVVPEGALLAAHVELVLRHLAVS
jgi:hypothetical protein